MLEDDNRTADQADAEWRRASDSLFGSMMPSSVPAAASSMRTSFFDEECVSGQRVSSPIEMEGPSVPPPEPIKSLFDEGYVSSRHVPSPIGMEGPSVPPQGPIGAIGPRAEPGAASSHSGPLEHIARLRDRIRRALRQQRPMTDFPVTRISSAEFNPTVNAAMHDLTAQRDRWDAGLHLMVHNEAADGFPLDPNRDYESEYQHASAQLNECNRSLYTIYADYLDKPSRPFQQPSESTANMAMTLSSRPLTDEETSPCPYGHIADQPSPPPTIPNMVVVEVTAETSRALFTRLDASATAVCALADSGASHVLFKASSAHILQNFEYSRKNDSPFAVLKAANHGVLTAIGRGFLDVADLRVQAFIFSDHNLANNLLRLLPFANLGCIGVFKPHSFHIFKGNERTRVDALKRIAFLRTWCKDKGKGVATSVPPKHLKGLEKYLWKWRLPIDEPDQLLLVRNVGLDANGCLCKASRKLAAALKFPHHVGAGGEESSS
jgi:hypothetical protein